MLTKGDIDRLEDSFLPKLAKKVKNEIKEPLEAINTKLDTFVGEIQKSREEQELHTHTHDRLDTRVNRLEKHTKLIPLAD